MVARVVWAAMRASSRQQAHGIVTTAAALRTASPRPATPCGRALCASILARSASSGRLAGTAGAAGAGPSAERPAVAPLDILTAPARQRREASTSTTSGAPSAVHALLPAAWWPYAELMRLDKPIGTWLLYAPCAVSIAMATQPGADLDLGLMALFGLGAVVMRGAGCTINDMWDADLDKHVRRTASRPIASGRVTQKQALAFLAGQLSVGLAVLLQLNNFSVALGASSLALVVAYPLAKRVTSWPQAVLGLVFNWGALLGWAAVRGECDWAVVLPLYAAGWGWTMVYDTVYAHQDRADDIVVGIKSTAVRLGDSTKAWLAGFGALSVAGLVAAGVEAGHGAPYFVGVVAAAAHGAHSVVVTRLDVADDCWRCFNRMKWGGAIVFAGAWANSALPNALAFLSAGQ